LKREGKEEKSENKWWASKVAALLSTCNLPVYVRVSVFEKGSTRREIEKRKNRGLPRSLHY